MELLQTGTYFDFLCIQIFDVISELYCNLLRKKWKDVEVPERVS